VKDAAMLGAASARAHGSTARLVGIIPSDTINWDQSVRNALFLRTGLKHNVRNVINGLTPDVVVVFGGGRGTLAEAAFALAARKPLFFCNLPSNQVCERLLENYRKYFAGTERTYNHDVDTYMQQPLTIFREAFDPVPSVAQLKKSLANFLSGAANTAGSAREIVRSCITAAANDSSLTNTGFPGLPGDLTAKIRFEMVINRISI
jgi:SLOG cluster4 family